MKSLAMNYQKEIPKAQDQKESKSTLTPKKVGVSLFLCTIIQKK